MRVRPLHQPARYSPLQNAGQRPQQQGGRAVADGPAGQSDQQAGQRITADAANVVGQQELQAPVALLGRNGHGQGAHQAATHAQTMTATEQPEYQR